MRGRNSDNTQIQETYGWAPSISLADGLERTYAWVYDQVKRARLSRQVTRPFPHRTRS